MHYTATTWSRCHSDYTTHLWEGAQTPLCQQRQSLSLQCNEFFLLYLPPRCLCSLLDPPAPHVNQIHVTGFTASLSMVQERTLTPAPTLLGRCGAAAWNSSSPKHLHCHNRARDGLQVLQHSRCLSKVFISTAQLLARAAVDVFTCLGGSTGSAGCEKVPLSWGSCSS